LQAANETVNWHPEHIKHGRFGDWLANNVDWAVSRERYWGTPLPIWRCEQGHDELIGSFQELKKRSGVELKDAHRPYVDEVHFPCKQCNQQMQRVPDVIDAWFDSGSMPFAARHFPFENEDQFIAHFPADFICEGLDQTRGWFYSLLAVSTLLFDRSSYQNVLCLGLILDAEGQKMSKSKDNVVEPWEVINQHGADAFRWYYYTSKHPWDDYRFSVDAVGDAVRHFLLQLWNTYSFYVLYANVNGKDPQAFKLEGLVDLDRWALSRLSATTELVDRQLENFDATLAGREIAKFLDDLSNWYVRRSRRRFWDGDDAAFATLHHCLITVAKLLAPFTPFIADEIFDNLQADKELSVHLCDFPRAKEVGERDPTLERAMAVIREAVRLGLAARAQAKVKLRQPLREAAVVASGEERAALERLGEIVCDELNVKGLRFVAGADELGRVEIKPNYRTLGPRFGRHMPQVAAAVEALDPGDVALALSAGRTIGVSVEGHDHALGNDDLHLAMVPLEGYQLEREGSHAVALDLTLDSELVEEGLAREVVRAVQATRKDRGLAVEDRIELQLAGSKELLSAVRTHENYVGGETLAVTIKYSDHAQGDATTAMIDGNKLQIDLRRTS
jgi:isoleucyl-tRNA synthetase